MSYLGLLSLTHRFFTRLLIGHTFLWSADCFFLSKIIFLQILFKNSFKSQSVCKGCQQAKDVAASKDRAQFSNMNKVWGLLKC